MKPHQAIINGVRIVCGLGGLLGSVWALSRFGTRAHEEGEARVAAGESRYQRHQVRWPGQRVGHA